MNPTANETVSMQLPPPVMEQAPGAPEAAPASSEKAPSIQPAPPVVLPPIALPAAPASPPQAASPAIPTVGAQSSASSAIDDKDLIEKEWVDKAKQIVALNRDDPYKQSEELTVFRADYMKKHYDKNIKLSN